jgi:hypothetical protein
MKIVVFVTVLVVSLSLVAAQNTETPKTVSGDQRQEQPKRPNKKMGTRDCAKANRNSGYAFDVRFPRSTRTIDIYNTEYPESGRHDPICLSKEAGDSMLWVSPHSKRFRISISPQKDPEKCGKHPFVKDPDNEPHTGFFSDSLRPDVPVGCIYEVQFKFEDGGKADPHIQVGK